MKRVMEFIKEEEQPTYGFNAKTMVETTEMVPVVQEPPKKRGPGRPPKNKDNTANTYTDPNTVIGRSVAQSPEQQYEKGYKGQAALLLDAIAKSEEVYNRVNDELNHFAENKLYGGKNRLQHVAEFMNTQIGVINSKINAVRELDNIRHKINEMMIKRLQMDKDVEENSDKAVMDAYYALVNSTNYGLPQMVAPLSAQTINTGVNMIGNPIQSNLIMDSSDIIRGDMDTSDASFEAYKKNLTPIQRKMILDNDPNIKTVVVYDQSSGNKYFDVVNVQTGQSVPGVTRPAEFLLDSMRIDARNGVAVNSNVNQTYPLVIIGTRLADEL